MQMMVCEDSGTMTNALTILPLTTVASQAPMSESPSIVYLARLSATSRRVMGAALESIASLLTGGKLDARALPWGELRYQHTQALRTKLAERFAPATANQHLSALRGVLKEAWRLGQLDQESYARAVDLEAVRGETLPAGRELDSGELRALFDVVLGEGGALAARDAALLSLLYGGGLRRSEAVSLDVADYDSNTGAITIRHGKGNKARIAYATNGGKKALDDWINIRGTETGPLLCPITKGGNIKIRRMTSQTVYDALKRRAEQAGVASFSPHDMRRTFISHLLDRGADISTVQKLAGHANVTTTARYDRRNEATKKKAAELLLVPYVGRRTTASKPT